LKSAYKNRGNQEQKERKKKGKKRVKERRINKLWLRCKKFNP
jgi:hypothetical protein